MSRRRPRLRAVALATLVLSAVLTGCASGLSESGDPLTVEQSELLAQSRFQLTMREEFTAAISSGDAKDVDRFAAEITVAAEDLAAWGTLHRGPEGVAVDEEIAFNGQAFATYTDAGWSAESWDRVGQQTRLGVIFSLISDRPENAQLLRQSDARYLGDETLGDTGLSVFRLPSTSGEGSQSRLWIDDDGAIVRLDDGGDGFVITITDDAPVQRPAVIDDLIALGEEAE